MKQPLIALALAMLLTLVGCGGGDASIPEDEAKEIALARVPGAAAGDIRGFRLERDDGRPVYEGTIYYDGMEYEFEIDAQTGDIRSWDAESIYD